MEYTSQFKENIQLEENYALQQKWLAEQRLTELKRIEKALEKCQHGLGNYYGEDTSELCKALQWLQALVGAGVSPDEAIKAYAAHVSMRGQYITADALLIKSGVLTNEQ